MHRKCIMLILLYINAVHLSALLHILQNMSKQDVLWSFSGSQNNNEQTGKWLMNVWNPKLLFGRLPDSGGLFVFILGRVCVYVRPLEEPHVLRNDPAHQEEHKYEVLLILKQFSAAARGTSNSVLMLGVFPLLVMFWWAETANAFYYHILLWSCRLVLGFPSICQQINSAWTEESMWLQLAALALTFERTNDT